MSYEIPGFTRSYESTGDLSGQQFRFVKKSGGVVAAVTAATDQVPGILQNKPGKPGVDFFRPGERNSATVMIDGVSRAVTGGAFAADALLTIDANGRVVAAGAGAKVVAQAEEASTAAGQVVAVLLKPLGGLVA